MTEVPMNEFEPVITQSAASMALNALAPYAEQFRRGEPIINGPDDNGCVVTRFSIRKLVSDYDERGVRIG